MKPVEIYTSPICPYCMMAKKLLKEKGVDYNEINVMGDQAMRDAMIKRANGRTSVPQIFIGDTHVGGNDDLQALARKGELDRLLAD